MDTEKIILFIIIGLVMVGIPVLLGRLTGSNPMDILFGDRIKKTIFGKKNAGQGEDPAGNDKKSGAKGKKKAKAPAVRKNSSKQELMKTISDLLTYGRRNRFYTIVPGTLMYGEDVATLAVLVVTRNSVLGFNCFGYGGDIYAGSGEEPWRQVLGGEEKQIDSPVTKNRKQKEILDAVLLECGYPYIRTEIFGVFTAEGVILKDHKNTHCCSKKALMEILKNNRFFEDGNVDPKKIGPMLDKYIKKA